MFIKNIKNTIYESKNKEYRIVEIQDEYADMENLKGDTFSAKVNPDLDPVQLRKEEKEFERLVNGVGVFGYVLEKWNPTPGIGWEHVDSCFGFVGQYDSRVEIFNHYIVEELKNQIKEGSSK